MNPCNNIASSGAIIVTLAFAFCRGGRSKPLLPDRRHDSARPWQSCPAVGNQTPSYALRPEARSRLNTVVSYFLGGASGAILGGLGAHLDAWIGLAASRRHAWREMTPPRGAKTERPGSSDPVLFQCSGAKIEPLWGAHELQQRYREALFRKAPFDVLPFNLVQLGFE